MAIFRGNCELRQPYECTDGVCCVQAVRSYIDSDIVTQLQDGL